MSRRRRIHQRRSHVEQEQQAVQRGAGENWGATEADWRATWGVMAPVSGECGGRR